VVRHARSDIAEARASEAQPAATPSSSR